LVIVLYEVFKELEWSNLDIGVLIETKTTGTGKWIKRSIDPHVEWCCERQELCSKEDLAVLNTFLNIN